jgi:hypothetical protein
MKKLILLFCVLAAGCTTTSRMSRQDLVNFKRDCAHKQEQLDFLRSQWPNDRDMAINTFTVTSLTGIIMTSADGTERSRREMVDGYYTTQLRLMIRDIQQTCPN